MRAPTVKYQATNDNQAHNGGNDYDAALFTRRQERRIGTFEFPAAVATDAV